MKQAFRKIKLGKARLLRLEQINAIIEEYKAGGYVLTLRQLYYQLVSRDIIPNQQKEYKKISEILKEGRMAGIVDWSAIEDRLRVPSSPSSWDSPGDILDSCVAWYARPRLKGQPNYVETWVEKDALSGVLTRVTEPFHVPIMVNRGYSSVSAMYEAYRRFKWAIQDGQKCVVLYLGDFDPSGVDMVRDVKDRICEFLLNCDRTQRYFEDNNGEAFTYFSFEDFIEDRFQIKPIALTKEQIRTYNPPPNPAKLSDSRSTKYIAEHGKHSWEVDALRPEVLHEVLETNIKWLLDLDLYEAEKDKEDEDRDTLRGLKDHC